MAKLRYSPGLLIGVILTVFFIAALLFRICLPYDQVFSADWIKFSSIDAYYQMRIVDNLVHNFPSLTGFDPYLIYPGGSIYGNIHFFNWLLALVTWIIGLGSPSQHLVDVIGVYFPAVLAALTLIPVYVIGKSLFNRWVGLIAACLLAVFPGEFLGRSILGFTDQHVAETLFVAVAVMFLILAVKKASEEQLSWGHVVRNDWAALSRPLLYSLLSGLFLGLYLITWMGALLFVFIITLYLVIQFIIDHLRGRSTFPLGFTGGIMFLVALVIFLPLSMTSYISVAVVFALLIPIVMALISGLMSGRGLSRWYYPAGLIVIGAIFVVCFYFISPSIFHRMISQFKIFFPAGASAATTLEMQPFLSPQGSFSTGVAWGNFTTSFFLFPSVAIPGFALISFVVIVYQFIRKRADDSGWLLFLVWTVIIFILTLVQRRFAYYLVLNMALLSAYLSWQAIWHAGLKKLALRREEARKKKSHYPESGKELDYYETLRISRNASPKEIKRAYRELSLKYHPELNGASEAEEQLAEIQAAYEVLGNKSKRAEYDRGLAAKPDRKKAKKRQEFGGITIYHVNTGLAILVVFILVFLFNITKSYEVASAARYAPTDAWQSSLTWMKDNTPEPFGDNDAYYDLHDEVPVGEDYEYPESAYGVTSWWDYGYWITRIAHRMPSANPSQDPGPITKIANLFLSSDETEVQQYMEELDSSYVIIDYHTCSSKFWAVVTWSGKDVTDLIGTYYVPYNGEYVAVQFYHEDYYNSLCVQLYNFNGEAVTNVHPVVITYEEITTPEGGLVNKVIDISDFTSYQEALDYIAKQDTGKTRIIGVNPFVSPVPLEAVESFVPVYSSETGISQEDVGLVPEVKIFEYIRD